MARDERGVTAQTEDFAAWYNEVVFKAGLVDELQLFVVPTIVGGGKQSLPRAVRLQLESLEERRFRNGMVYLRYRTRP